MEKKSYRRIRKDSVIAGVCTGLADFFDLDPVMVRLMYAILTIFTAFSGVWVYLLIWMIVPEKEA